MKQELARYQLTPRDVASKMHLVVGASTCSVLQAICVKLHAYFPASPQHTAVVQPRIVSKLRAILRQLDRDGVVCVYALPFGMGSAVYYPAYTQAWPSETWDGSNGGSIEPGVVEQLRQVELGHAVPQQVRDAARNVQWIPYNDDHGLASPPTIVGPRSQRPGAELENGRENSHNNSMEPPSLEDGDGQGGQEEEEEVVVASSGHMMMSLCGSSIASTTPSSHDRLMANWRQAFPPHRQDSLVPEDSVSQWRCNPSGSTLAASASRPARGRPAGLGGGGFGGGPSARAGPGQGGGGAASKLSKYQRRRRNRLARISVREDRSE
ncbi:hypothetical protein UCDDA912_g10252 [Diaporthe ampelina]|uniref:Uncharacterized protein n=1 Tax=Diaporthe ampelina TaxID=1214573 RepID=A0A0G2F6I1_9PEZI|nr:hypothetical protein UCDDA912_g10252 [Diaporthe ampelina]